MKAIGWKALLLPALGLVLASCGILPARRPIGAPAPSPTTSPTPSPLLVVQGSAQVYRSGNIAVPVGGLRVDWRYDCQNAADGSWRVAIFAAQGRGTAHREHETLLVAQPPEARRAAGAGLIQMRGFVYVTVVQTPGCTRRIEVVPGD